MHGIHKRLNIIDFPWIATIAEKGRDERSTWQLTWSGSTGPRHRFNPVWDMVLEGSTGFSGAFARQVTFSKDAFDDTLLIAMESAASQGAVVLEADGAFIDNAEVQKVQLQFDPDYKGGVYVDKSMQGKYYPNADLIRYAELGKFIGTFTARHGVNVDVNSPQPALWTLGSIHEQRKQDFPTVTTGRLSMTISGRHFKDDAKIFVDGVRVNGAVSVKSNEKVVITLASAPTTGMHLLQVQVPDGMFSNDFIFYVKE